MSCPICLEDIYDEFIILNCNCTKTMFHSKCVTSWFKIKNNCPICKCEFKNTLQLKKTRLFNLNNALFYDSINKYSLFKYK